MKRLRRKSLRLNLMPKHLINRLCLVFVCGVMACTFQVPKDREVLVWHLSAEPDTLNPLLSTDVYASRVNSFLFDSLIKRNNETLEFESQLAERWTISEDKRVFTFYLRDGLKWHDGTPVTVDDIIFSFERIMDPKVDTPHMRVYYQEIEKVEKVEEGVVRFTYQRPYFMALNFCGGIPILPRHLYQEGDFNRSPQGRGPVGNGPYRFVHWKTGRSIRIERNENYWGPKPAIQAIEFRIIPEDTVALQVLKKGDLDLAGMRPIQWVRQTGSERFAEKFQKHKYYTPGYSFIGWNLRRPYFTDRVVRQALTHLVNRQKILETLNFDLGKVVTGPFYTEGPDYNRAIAPLPYDPDRAYQLLESAGWIDRDGDGIRDKNGQVFQFEFLIPSGRRFAEQLATILKEDFRKAGIDMSIRKLEWALFVQKLNDRSFDAVTLGWSFGFEQDPYQVWHSSQAERGSNFVGFINEEVDVLIDEARVIFDREERSARYHRLHQLIHEEQPYTFLFATPSLVAVDRRFQNVRVYPVGLDPLEWTLQQGEL